MTGTYTASSEVMGKGTGGLKPGKDCIDITEQSGSTCLAGCQGMC